MSILRKYYNDKCDLPSLFSNVAFLLRFVTLKIFHDTKRPPFCSYLVTYSAVVSYSYVYMFSMVWFVFIRCRETGDLVAASVVFSLGTNSAPCVTKFIFMNVYRNTMCELITRYLECDAQVIVGSRLHTNISKHLQIVKKRAIAVWVSLTGIAFLYILRALIRPGRHFPEDLYVVYGLEPSFESPNFEISYFLMALCISVAVYQLSTVKALVVIMVGYIEAQILALSEESICIWKDAEQKYEDDKKYAFAINRDDTKRDKNRIINERIRLKLKEILQFHVAIVNILNDFDKLYRLISAADFALILSAIISELLGKLENTFVELPYTFLQIYIDCYIGQKLIDASEKFQDAVYSFEWDNFDTKNRKIVLLLLRVSQKTITITVGGVSPLNYETLSSLIFYTQRYNSDILTKLYKNVSDALQPPSSHATTNN